MNEIRTLADKIVRILDDKKAKDIKVLNVTELTTIADYFIKLTGSSNTHLKSLSDNLEEKLGHDGIKHMHKEGYSGASWILLGYDGILVHLFLQDTRDFYDLERVWVDAEVVDMSDIIGTEIEN